MNEPKNTPINMKISIQIKASPLLSLPVRLTILPTCPDPNAMVKSLLLIARLQVYGFFGDWLYPFRVDLLVSPISKAVL